MLAVVWRTNTSRQFLLGRKFISKSNHKPLEFPFNPDKVLPKVTSSSILSWVIKLIAFDFQTEVVKGNTVSLVEVLLKLNFKNNRKERRDNLKDKILHWIETDELSWNLLAFETLQHLGLSKIRYIINKQQNMIVLQQRDSIKKQDVNEL